MGNFPPYEYLGPSGLGSKVIGTLIGAITLYLDGYPVHIPRTKPRSKRQPSRLEPGCWIQVRGLFLRVRLRAFFSGPLRCTLRFSTGVCLRGAVRAIWGFVFTYVYGVELGVWV